MTSVNKEYEQFKKLLENLINSGIEETEALKFIEENIDTLSREDTDVNDNIYFILNNQDIYGILYIIKDSYYWSNLINGKLTSLKTLDNSKTKNTDSADYIIEMVIHFANNKKIIEMMPEITSYSLEEKLRVLKNMDLNTNGYHVK